MNCKNCMQKIAGNFCVNCGQSTKVDEINVAYVFRELSDSVFQLNKGFFYTIQVLFMSPGTTIREYLAGKRQRIVKPIAYVFALSTFYFLLSKITETDTFLNDLITGWSSSLPDSEAKTPELTVFNWFAENYAFTMLMTLPFYALSTYLAFKELSANYFQHLVLNIYITGQQAIIYSVFAIFGLFVTEQDVLSLVTLIISISYAFFVLSQFFDCASRLSFILRGLLAYAIILGLIFIITLLLVIVFS